MSGYRRYRRDQVRTARLIRALRWVALPVDEIRTAATSSSCCRPGPASRRVLPPGGAPHRGSRSARPFRW
ncbi:MAG: MerR family transcriptional regulator [Kribbellaceae bacterium]